MQSYFAPIITERANKIIYIINSSEYLIASWTFKISSIMKIFLFIVHLT